MLLHVDVVLRTYVYSIITLYVCKCNNCLWDSIKRCVAIVLLINCNIITHALYYMSAVALGCTVPSGSCIHIRQKHPWLCYNPALHTILPVTITTYAFSLLFYREGITIAFKVMDHRNFIVSVNFSHIMLRNRFLSLQMVNFF